ncbi:MAG: hypothetical protein WEB37_02605 [Bacteroidota bacterium]
MKILFQVVRLPNNVYTNIIGGRGVFGAMTSDSICSRESLV